MRYEMLVVDLDGTLVAPDGRVDARDVAALDRAVSAGLEVVIATGRALVEAAAVLDRIGYEGEVIAAGGSLRQCARTGVTVDRRAMPAPIVSEIAEFLLEHEHRVLLLKDPHAAGYDYLAIGDAALDPASEWWFESMSLRVTDVGSIDDDPHPDDTMRVSVVASADELDPIATHLRSVIGDRAFVQHWAAVTESAAMNAKTHLLEAFTRGVNKWTAVERFARVHGIDHVHIAAIGDGLNDVDLVREAALGVAMANSDERVLAVADRTTGAVGAGGVADAVESILEGDW